MSKHLFKYPISVICCSIFSLPVLANPGIKNESLDARQTRSHNLAQEDARYQKDAIEKSDRWGLMPEEWKRYEYLMRGPAKFAFKDQDPLVVLGIYANTQQERTRYAKLYSEQEYDRIQGLLAMDRAFTAEYKKLSLKRDNGVVFDPGLLGIISDRKKGLGNRSSLNSIETIALSKGDRLVLFVGHGCNECDDAYQQAYTKARAENSVLDIYYMGNDVKDGDIRSWARKTGVNPVDVKNGLVTLNHDNGVSKRFGAKSYPSIFVRVKDDK